MYDTAYAMADRPEDVKIGVKSSAIGLGKYDVFVLSLLQIAVVVLLGYLGILLKFSWIYFVSILIAALLFVYQYYLIRDRIPTNCFKAFLNNQWVGVVIFLGIFFGFLY